MARPKGSKNKVAFDDLSEEFKTAIAQSSREEVKNRIAEIAMAESNNQTMKAADQDLADKKEQVKLAAEGYVGKTKDHKLKIAYMMQVIGDKGGDTSGSPS